MTEPAIVAAVISVSAVLILALANLVYRFGKVAAQVEHLRHDQTRRYGDWVRTSKERYEGLIHRLERLESHFIARSTGDD